MQTDAATAARLEVSRRQDRRKIFHKYGIFSDATWEILLDLYVANLDGKQLSTTSVGLDANLPLSTCIRWVKLLESAELISRANDVLDARRQWIKLTADAEKLLDAHFVR